MFWLLSRPREEIKTRPFVLTLAPTCARPRLKCAWLSSDEAPSFKFHNPISAEVFLFHQRLWEHTFCEPGWIYIMFRGIEGNVTLQKGLICNDYNVYSHVRRQQSQTILPSGCSSSKPKSLQKAQVLLDGQQPAEILSRVKQSKSNPVSVPKLNPGSNQRYPPTHTHPPHRSLSRISKYISPE